MSKKILAVILALTLIFVLCACGNDESKSTEPEQTKSDPVDVTEDSTEENTDSSDDTVTYTITVVDAQGAPLSGVMVQLCGESCSPGQTDANGVATYHLPEADYHAGIMIMPDGYTYTVEPDADGYFYFEDGATDIVITLQAEEG